MQLAYYSSKALVDCAMGRTPADLVIKDGRWVCVQTGEVVEHTDVAILDGRFAYIGEDASHTIGEGTRVIDAQGRHLVPGLLDGHMHVESGMLTVSEFVRAVLPHGTTGMFIDPHEIANVFGLRGVRLMVEEARQQPIHVYVQMPSCVPSAPGFETPGATIGPAEVAEAMTWPGIIGLGEMMNFPGVYNGDDKVHSEMAVTRQSGKVIGGHFASPELGLHFHGYAAGGPQDDHEGTRKEDALARARQGMRVMMRYGSGWKDVKEQVKAILEDGLEIRLFSLCTDDSHSETLINEGHMDRAIRHAVSEGLTPMAAIQMATINTAEHFGLTREMGMIAPGRHADLVLVADLNDFSADMVLARGEVVVEDGKLLTDHPQVRYPDWALHSVHFPHMLTPDDFAIPALRDFPHTAHVIGIIEHQAPTRHLLMTVIPQNGEIQADMKRDVMKLALIERHHNTGKVQMGLVQGFGFKCPCAVASTVAHDAHNMIVVGTDGENMAIAANHLAAMDGGQIVVKDGKVIGKVTLPIAGLMSDQPAARVAEEAATVLEGLKECGCSLQNANMQLSLLGLVVIPELRISDLGLVDTVKFDFVHLLE
ncbi:MAG TPA: adenine deaminase [Anaerolineaceae bacterium]|nr:adenine deaminase [Anaerolineaceae bacterium]